MSNKGLSELMQVGFTAGDTGDLIYLTRDGNSRSGHPRVMIDALASELPSLTLSGTLTITPPAADKAFLTEQEGPITLQTGPFMYNEIDINDDVPVSGDTRVFGLYMQYNTGGTHGLGGKYGAFFNMNHHLDSTTGGDHIALVSQCFSSAADLSGGELYGSNTVCTAASGCQTPGVNGLEVDVTVSSGASVTRRCGVRVVNEGNSVASGLDTAFAVMSTTLAGSFKTGMSLSTNFGQPGLAATGSWFAVDGAQTIANFANCSNLTVTGNILNFPNFQITGAGALTQARQGGIWTDTAAFKNFTVTITIATPAVITWTAHGFAAGQRIQFTTTGALPTGLTASTTYFVLAAGLTANSFRVSATDGGTAINTTGSQSGVHSGHIIGVNIARFERVFIGDAVNNDGTLVGSQGNVWLDAYDSLITTSADLSVVSRSGLAAAVFAVRTSDRPTGASNAIAGSFYAVNDNTTVAQVAFGIYTEVFRPIGGGTIHCMEMDATEFGTANSVLPYTSSFSGVSSGLWVASGGGNEVGTTDASIAIHILNNNSKWKTGITFDADGITGTDGATGTGEAIALAKGHQQNWYYAGNNIGFTLYSDVAASGDKQTELVDTNGFSFLNNSAVKNFRIAKVSGAVTGSLAVQGSTSASPSLIAEGSATNISVTISGKGTANLFLDPATISTGGAASTGAVIIELGGGRTGSGNSTINFHSVNGTGGETQLLRGSGANGNFTITNGGTGQIQLNANNASGLIQNLINNVDKLRIDGSGPITQIGTATPAAASAIPMIRAGASAIGIYTGSGDPNAALTAAQGSIYLRTNGGASTRIYSNSNGGTAWAAVTSA